MAGERILIVDDEDMIWDLCSQIFFAEGYAVTTMSNGESALDELRRGSTDLLRRHDIEAAISGTIFTEVVRRELCKEAGLQFDPEVG